MQTDIKTDKDIFQTVRDFLLKQNAKSMNDSGDCQYRGFSSGVVESIQDEMRAMHQDDDWEFDYDLYLDKLADYPHDAMCAIGCLIADEHYDYEMEGNGATEEFVIQAVILSNPSWDIHTSGLKMLTDLQKIHDRMPVESWKEIFEKMSELFSEDNSYKYEDGKLLLESVNS